MLVNGKAVFQDIKGLTRKAIVEAFGNSAFKVTDRVDAVYEMAIGPKEGPGKVRTYEESVVNRPFADNHPFVAERPKSIPDAIDEPLLMAAYVNDWVMGDKTAGVDIVYSIWTRAGKQVETQRVRVESTFMKQLQESLRFSPGRHRLMGSSTAKDYWSESGPMQSADLFRWVLEQNARAMAFPYGARKMIWNAVWDDRIPSVKPGIALADKEKYDEAYASWKAVADKDPKAAPAWHNMSVVHEMRGEDERSLALHEKALALDRDRWVYQLATKEVKERVALRKKGKIKLPAPPDPKEEEAEAPEAPAGEETTD